MNILIGAVSASIFCKKTECLSANLIIFSVRQQREVILDVLSTIFPIFSVRLHDPMISTYVHILFFNCEIGANKINAKEENIIRGTFELWC